MTDGEAYSLILDKFADDTITQRDIEAWLDDFQEKAAECACDELLAGTVEDAVRWYADDIAGHAVGDLIRARRRKAERAKKEEATA